MPSVGWLNERGKDGKLTIIGGVFLASDHGLGMEERPVRADLHVVDNARLKIRIDGTRDVFSASGLGKESREAILSGFCARAFLKAAVGLCVSGALATMI